MVMAVYHRPAGLAAYGLGQYEQAALQRLSPTSARLLMDELTEPGSRATVVEVLRARDPEAALAQQIGEDIALAADEIMEAVDAGLGEYEWPLYDGGMGGLKKLRRRIKKKIHGTVKSVAKRTGRSISKVAKSVGKSVKKVAKSVGKKIMPVLKQWAPIIIGVLGAVLAPVTGGASLAIAAILTTAYKVAQTRKEAKKIEKINKREAAAMSAEVAAQEEELGKEVDKLYTDNQAVFVTAGITPEDWAKLTLEQKLSVIEKINKGEMPASQEAADAKAEEEGVPPPQQQAWQDAIKDAPISQAYAEAEAQQPIEPPPEGAPPAEAPPAGPPPAAPTGAYVVYVEGNKVGEVGTAEEMAKLVAAQAQPGDRVEVVFNGQSTGLKIRTTAGLVGVPKEHEEQVRGLPKAQVAAFVAKAEERAKAGMPGAGFPWWLLLVGGAAAAAAAA